MSCIPSRAMRGDTLPTLTMDGRIATITLRRPDVANRLGSQDIAQLRDHLQTVNGSDVLVLRLMSTGKYFCSGFHIGELAAGEDAQFEGLANALEDCRPMTIAALQGGVYGGATDLALACDFRVGTHHTNMFMPAVRLGLHFYERGMQRYVSRLGIDMAKRLFLTAQKLDAQRMLACGFLTDLVAPEQLDTEVQHLSQTLAGMAPLALLGMKKHLNHIARNAADSTDIAQDVLRTKKSADLLEGRHAWMQKRVPKFTGH